MRGNILATEGQQAGINDVVEVKTGVYLRKISANIVKNSKEHAEPDCREGARAQLERMKELCKERSSLYEKQNGLKGQNWKIENR